MKRCEWVGGKKVGDIGDGVWSERINGAHPERMHILADHIAKVKRLCDDFRKHIQRTWREWPICPNGNAVALTFNMVSGEAFFTCQGCAVEPTVDPNDETKVWPHPIKFPPPDDGYGE